MHRNPVDLSGIDHDGQGSGIDGTLESGQVVLAQLPPQESMPRVRSLPVIGAL